MRLIAGSLYVTSAVVLAAIAAWPIYRSSSFVVLVVVASLLGGAIAALVTWRRWSGWAAAGLVAAAVLVAGVPLAVPARLGTPDQVLRGLGELVTGVLFGWKDLLTVDLPVGSYRNLLVPALVVFMAGTCAALLLAWRKDSVAVLAVGVAIAMSGFGLLFGRTEVSAALRIGAVTLVAPVETAVGIGTLLCGMGWLAWRSRDARVRAVQRAADASGVRLRTPRGAGVRRVALGGGMVVIAVAAALAVPTVTAGAEREVLREATGPRLELSRAISPLASYRAFFADGTVGEVLFSAHGDASPDRIRLAVLDDYDGAVFRTGAEGTAFTRVAGSRDAGPGTAVDLDVVVGMLDGLWMPSAGTLASVTFEGPRAAELSDGFYVNDELAAAVQTTAWAPGDSYRLRAAVAEQPALADVTAPGVQADAAREVDAPASLRAWVAQHATGSDGAALASLVDLLRSRGYLSHALTAEGGDAEWMRQLGDYAFAPSAAGHSLARIDEMFAALLERESDPRAAASDNFVAAVGDDEQFAVAVALIARELGFPARVVVGARVATADPDVAVCAEGNCRAGDISAWVEVRSAAGEWIAVDVTPQHAQEPSREVTEQPDPTIGTVVRPPSVDEVQPPKPAQEDTASPPPHDEEVDLSWLWTTLRVSAWIAGALALIAGPFVLIVAAKALRRRGRRRAPLPEARIAGGWEEFLDAATDAGQGVPREAALAATRSEIAASMAVAEAVPLARSADLAVFSDREVTATEAEEYWHAVETQRRAFAPTLWQRVRAALSLRSFVPGGTRRRPSHTERGSRAVRAARHTA